MHDEIPCEKEKMPSGKTTAFEKISVTFDVLDLRESQPVVAVNSVTLFSHAASQSTQINWNRRRHTTAEDAKSTKREVNENRKRNAAPQKSR